VDAGGLVIHGALEPADVDVFEVPLAAGDLVTATLLPERAGQQIDGVLGLFAPGAATPATRDDDDGPGLLPSLHFRVPGGQGGTWRVAVSGADDADFDGSHQQAFGYRLVVSRPPATHDESNEGGNDTSPEPIPNPGASFQSLAPGGVVAVEGALLADAGGGESDVDLFGLPVPDGQTLFAAAFREDELSSEDPVVRLRRPSSAEVARDDDDGPALLPSLVLASPAPELGNWTLEITRFEPHPEVDHDLPYTLVFAAAPVLCDANADEAVDQVDIQAIFDGRGALVPLADPRDVNGDGRLTVGDGRACTARCDLPGCLPAGAGGCGLVGVEALLPAALVGQRRRLRSREDRR
jgi:hypothetical protein